MQGRRRVGGSGLRQAERDGGYRNRACSESRLIDICTDNGFKEMPIDDKTPEKFEGLNKNQRCGRFASLSDAGIAVRAKS